MEILGKKIVFIDFTKQKTSQLKKKIGQENYVE